MDIKQGKLLKVGDVLYCAEYIREEEKQRSKLISYRIIDIVRTKTPTGRDRLPDLKVVPLKHSSEDGSFFIFGKSIRFYGLTAVEAVIALLDFFVLRIFFDRKTSRGCFSGAFEECSDVIKVFSLINFIRCNLDDLNILLIRAVVADAARSSHARVYRNFESQSAEIGG